MLRLVAPRDARDEAVEVMVELPPLRLEEGVDRRQRMRQSKQAFSDAVAPVEAAIEALGGHVLAQAWINRTLRARLPSSKVHELSSRADVKSVGVPHALSLEGS